MVVTLTEPREAGGVPGKSSLFFLTITRLFGCKPSRFERFSFFFFFSSLSAGGRKVSGGRREREGRESFFFGFTLLGLQLFWRPWNQVIWRRGTMIGRASHFLRRPVRLLTALENRGEHGTGAPSL